MSRIRANQITNQSADGAPTVQNGLVISGVTTSTTFSGSGASLTNIPSAQLTGALPALDGSNLTGITQTTINNNANNRIITGSGTANTLEGESTITYDNPTLEINTDTSPYAALNLNGNTGGLIQFEDNEVVKWSIFGDSALNFYDNPSSASRLYINNNGNIGVGTDTAPHKFSVKGTISMISGASGTQIVNLSQDGSNNGNIYFAWVCSNSFYLSWS